MLSVAKFNLGAPVAEIPAKGCLDTGRGMNRAMNRRDFIRYATVNGLVYAGTTSFARTASSSRSPVIAVASSMRFCMTEIRDGFAASTGEHIRLVFGSSGNLVRQVEQGAPFALFLSADESFANRLVTAGLTIDQGAVYAIGRLVLAARKDKLIAIDSEMQGLRQALSSGKINRFAIANPAHAPYGLRAREALQQARLWTALKTKLALGENVAQAAQFVGSGAADAGLIANSLARAPQLAKLINIAAIPASWHKPMDQRMVRLKSVPDQQKATAGKFYAFMHSGQVRAILQRHGFGLPPLA